MGPDFKQVPFFGFLWMSSKDSKLAECPWVLDGKDKRGGEVGGLSIVFVPFLSDLAL